MNPRSKAFDKLKAKWDKKLKASGFEDAEQPDGRLKRWHKQDILSRVKGFSNPRANETAFPKLPMPDLAAERTEYFYMAEHFATSHKFESKLHQRIWTMHAQGMSSTEIAKKVKWSHDFCSDVVNKLKKVMLGV